MTDLRTRLADTLREHELAEYSWGVDGCNCGDDETEGHPEHVADMLLEVFDIRIWPESKDET